MLDSEEFQNSDNFHVRQTALLNNRQGYEHQEDDDSEINERDLDRPENSPHKVLQNEQQYRLAVSNQDERIKQISQDRKTHSTGNI